MLLWANHHFKNRRKQQTNVTDEGTNHRHHLIVHSKTAYLYRAFPPRARWNFAQPSRPTCLSAMPSFTWNGATSRRGPKNQIYSPWVNLIPAACATLLLKIVKNRRKSLCAPLRIDIWEIQKKIHRSTLEQGTYEKIKQLLDDKTKNKDYTVVMWDLKGVVGEGNNMDMSAIMVWDIIMIVDRC